MAHRIEELDAHYATEQAWHGLSIVVPEITFANCYLANWDVVPVTLFGPDGEEVRTVWQDEKDKEEEVRRPKSKEEEEEEEKNKGKFFILQCTDNKRFIGKPFTTSYRPITNAEFLKVAKDALSGTNHKIVSMGSVRNRGRVFLSVKLDGLDKFKVGHREFEPYFNLGNSHDMSSVLWANTSNVCTVCDNTFGANLAIEGKAVNIRVKHTKNCAARLENLPQLIDAAIGVQREFMEAFASFASDKCSHERAERIFTGFLVNEDPETAQEKMRLTSLRRSDLLTTRTANTVGRLVDLFHSSKKGNRGESLADVFSAGTDYYSHESSGDSPNRFKQFMASEFGSGLKKKTELYNLLKNGEKLAETERRGSRILALTNN